MNRLQTALDIIFFSDPVDLHENLSAMLDPQGIALFLLWKMMENDDKPIGFVNVLFLDMFIL